MNSEPRLLLDRANEELRACDQLLDDELFSQAAARAYRAMLRASEALMADEGLEYSSEAGLQASFGQLLLRFGGVDPRFHTHILTAFRQRQAADHRPPTDVSAERARELLAQAGKFVEMAESYLDEDRGGAGESSR